MDENKQRARTVLLAERERPLNTRLTSRARILEAGFHNVRVTQMFESAALLVRQTLLL